MSKIGKNILENLTNGMYDDSRMIYREYIQNAADAIDAAKNHHMFTTDDDLEIVITLDEKRRKIIIEDNATGIPKDEVDRRLGDVADSKKVQGETKGFRGIGRLGGIGYCNQLRFVTSSFGEDVQTTMIWDAQRLAEIVSDNEDHRSAEAVLKEIIHYEYEPCDKKKHFFRVELLGVTTENKQLLDKDTIHQYLSEVAPVDFSTLFIYKTKINKFLQEHVDEIQPINTYKIILRKSGGEITPVYKGYKGAVYKNNNGKIMRDDDVKDVQTDIIRDTDGKAVAWIWYAITSFKGSLVRSANPMRGLRLRQFNIEIGDGSTLDNQKGRSFFKEDRGNGYFLGEVHVIDTRLRPNARRDYFNESEETDRFEYALKTYIQHYMDPLYRTASKLNSSYKKIEKADELKKKFKKKKKTGFAYANEESELREKLEDAQEKAEKAAQEIDKVEKNVESESKLDDKSPKNGIKKMIKAIKEGKSEQIKKWNRESRAAKSAEKNKEKKDGNKKEKDDQSGHASNLLTKGLSKLNRSERKLIARVYEVIHKNLIEDEANALIEKIQEELKK